MESCPSKKQFEQCQRVYVTRETEGADKLIKIVLERFDEGLGWYQAGALSVPLHQLPLLQQSLGEFSVADCHETCDGSNCPSKIICFPMLLAGAKTSDAAATES